MKKFLISILGSLLLIACCPASSSSQAAGSLVERTEIEWHHAENCCGHSATIEKITFELEGHEMWLLNISNRDGDTIIHSPDCPKCKNTSTKSSTTESISDYWGW